MANQIPIVIADFETQLSGAISAGDTSFSLASATDDDGNALAAGKYCFTVNNGRSDKQYLLGQLNGTSVTSVVSVDRRGNETSGAAYSARSGAPIIISDFATIQRVADILRGQEELDGDNPVAYDAEPSLSNREELATVGYVLDTVTGGTVSFDKQIISSSETTAGEAISADNLVYFKTSDQEWYKTDADTAATVNDVQLGIALGTGSDGVSITGGVQVAGVYTTSGLIAGDTYYASNTAGEYTNSAGTTSRPIGIALSTTKLLLIPANLLTPTANEKAALAGGGYLGTPSSSNKFLTETSGTQVVEFTSSGTWTKDAGLVRIRVQAWGGGGSGGAENDSSAAYGGGGAGYFEAWFEASELGATETVTVGAGGAAVSGAATNGNNGANTTFGSLLTAYGGQGGQADAGGNGGDIQSGSTLFRGAGGASGGDGLFWGGGGGAQGQGATAGDALWGGAGGSGYGITSGGTPGTSLYGGNGGAGANTGTATSGSVPGGGGGGNSNGTSGAGGDGKVIVTEYYS